MSSSRLNTCAHCQHWDRDGRGSEHYTGDPDVAPVELSQRRCLKVVTYDRSWQPSVTQAYLVASDPLYSGVVVRLRNHLALCTPEDFFCASFERRGAC